jgi:hypothetical protein
VPSRWRAVSVAKDETSIARTTKRIGSLRYFIKHRGTTPKNFGNASDEQVAAWKRRLDEELNLRGQLCSGKAPAQQPVPRRGRPPGRRLPTESRHPYPSSRRADGIRKELAGRTMASFWLSHAASWRSFASAVSFVLATLQRATTPSCLSGGPLTASSRPTHRRVGTYSRPTAIECKSRHAWLVIQGRRESGNSASSARGTSMQRSLSCSTVSLASGRPPGCRSPE